MALTLWNDDFSSPPSKNIWTAGPIHWTQAWNNDPSFAGGKLSTNTSGNCSGVYGAYRPIHSLSYNVTAVLNMASGAAAQAIAFMFDIPAFAATEMVGGGTIGNLLFPAIEVRFDGTNCAIATRTGSEASRVVKATAALDSDTGNDIDIRIEVTRIIGTSFALTVYADDVSIVTWTSTADAHTKRPVMATLLGFRATSSVVASWDDFKSTAHDDVDAPEALVTGALTDWATDGFVNLDWVADLSLIPTISVGRYYATNFRTIRTVKAFPANADFEIDFDLVLLNASFNEMNLTLFADDPDTYPLFTPDRLDDTYPNLKKAATLGAGYSFQMMVNAAGRKVEHWAAGVEVDEETTTSNQHANGETPKTYKITGVYAGGNLTLSCFFDGEGTASLVFVVAAPGVALYLGISTQNATIGDIDLEVDDPPAPPASSGGGTDECSALDLCMGLGL